MSPSSRRSALARVREALVAAADTVRGVKELLGDQAHRALGRNETTPALRLYDGGFAVVDAHTAVALQATVALDEAQAALPGLVEPLCVAGVLEISVGEVGVGSNRARMLAPSVASSLAPIT